MTPAPRRFFFSIMPSSCGPLRCVVNERGAVARVDFERGRWRGQRDEWWQREGVELIEDASRTRELVRQLEQYFAGRRREFELVLAPRGTDFQLAVWRALSGIPFGETRSYSEIARAIDKPDAVRAVGAANGANPIPIIVPCHRVIGANGSLTGFGGGLDAKETLLRLEGISRYAPSKPQQLSLL